MTRTKFDSQLYLDNVFGGSKSKSKVTKALTTSTSSYNYDRVQQQQHKTHKLSQRRMAKIASHAYTSKVEQKFFRGSTTAAKFFRDFLNSKYTEKEINNFKKLGYGELVKQNKLVSQHTIEQRCNYYILYYFRRLFSYKLLYGKQKLTVQLSDYDVEYSDDEGVGTYIGPVAQHSSDYSREVHDTIVILLYDWFQHGITSNQVNASLLQNLTKILLVISGEGHLLTLTDGGNSTKHERFGQSHWRRFVDRYAKWMPREWAQITHKVSTATIPWDSEKIKKKYPNYSVNYVKHHGATILEAVEFMLEENSSERSTNRSSCLQSSSESSSPLSTGLLLPTLGKLWF